MAFQVLDLNLCNPILPPGVLAPPPGSEQGRSTCNQGRSGCWDGPGLGVRPLLALSPPLCVPALVAYPLCAFISSAVKWDDRKSTPPAVRRKCEVCEQVLRPETSHSGYNSPSPAFWDEWTAGESGAAGGQWGGGGGKRWIRLSPSREAGECLTQPTPHDKRNLLTRSPCSGKELFPDPPAASQGRSGGAGLPQR